VSCSTGSASSQKRTAGCCARPAPVATPVASAIGPSPRPSSPGVRISDRSLLAGEATLLRLLAGADLGRVKKAQAVNATMLRRAWAMGTGPGPGILTIDPDATYVDTYGPSKEGSRFSYKGQVQLSPSSGWWESAVTCSRYAPGVATRAREASSPAFSTSAWLRSPSPGDRLASSGYASTRPGTHGR